MAPRGPHPHHPTPVHHHSGSFSTSWQCILMASPPITTRQMADLGGAMLRLWWLVEFEGPWVPLVPSAKPFALGPAEGGPAGCAPGR